MKSIDSYKENNAYGGVESNINFFCCVARKLKNKRRSIFFCNFWWRKKNIDEKQRMHSRDE